MSANSSSSSNATLPPLNTPSPESLYSFIHNCTFSTTGIFQTTLFSIFSLLLLLPLCIFVLHLGVQQWRQRRPGMTMSHSDVFTFHMVAAELIGISASVILSFGVHMNQLLLIFLGTVLGSINFNAQQLFHTLTCMERYLAVCHPVTYRSLRKTKAIRIRNVTIGCVWLLCFAGIAFLYINDLQFVQSFSYFALTSIFIIFSFCCLSVLRVLIRPGPGDGGGDKQRVDRSKLRAFYTITAILGVLTFRLMGNILVSALYDSPQLEKDEQCALWLGIGWFCLPSSLVLPLLYLQRDGKLVCCKFNKISEPGSD